MTAEYFLKIKFKEAFLVPLVSVNQYNRIYADNDKKTRRLFCVKQELSCKSFNVIIGKFEIVVIYSIIIKTVAFHDSAVFVS